MSKLSLSAAALVVMGLVSAVNAATVTYTQSYSGPTNWAQAIALPKFNPSMGSLQSVLLTLVGTVGGSAGFENTDPQAATIVTSRQGNFALTRPNGSSLTLTSSVTTTDSVTGYDGNLNFGGTSGKTYSNLWGTGTASAAMTATEIPNFLGLGSISIPVAVLATASASGSGNLLAQFNTNATADVLVTYTYAIPTPTSLAAGLLLLGGLFVRRRLMQRHSF